MREGKVAHPNPPGELLAMPFIESGVCVTCQLNFEVFTLSDDQILKEKIKIRKRTEKNETEKKTILRENNLKIYYLI